jgi:hypothetical protein
METPLSTISTSSTPETPLPQDTAVRQLDFGESEAPSVFVDSDVTPEVVGGFYEYTMTLTPESAEQLSNDLDGILSSVNRVLVTSLDMTSEGVFFQEAETEGEMDEYIMRFESTSDPDKVAGIRIPVTPSVSNVFIRVSRAFTEEEASGTIVQEVDNALSNVISGLSSPLEDDADGGVLRGLDDKNLLFYEKIMPVFATEPPVPNPLPINNTVYDQEASKDVMLQDFVMPGNKLVFLFNGKQVGISYTPFINNVREGNSIFYECTREFTFDPITNRSGRFDPSDVYAQPYIELALISRMYITLDDFNKLLNVPVHPYWEIKDSGRTLNVTASRSSVVAGGPVQSQLHCQNGSDLKVYNIEPYMPTKDEEEEEGASEVPTIVTFQRGEDRTPMDVSQNANAADVKRAYAIEKGIPPESIQLVVQGKLLALEQITVDPEAPAVVALLEKDVTLVPGTSVTVVNARLPPPPQGARRTYRRRRKNKRKTNKMPTKYKNVR